MSTNQSSRNEAQYGDPGRRLRVIDLGRCAYRPALARQEAQVHARREGGSGDTLFLVEHDRVYTLGRNATAENMLVTPDVLTRRGIEVIRVGRGGQVTYHGPGQLVGYPILHLGELGMSVTGYVAALEEVLIRALARFGVEAGRDPVHRGVWVGNRKIAAIGVRVSRRVTMHGFALNVNTDLDDYDAIVPCGIRDRGVTRLRDLAPEAGMDDVRAAVVQEFSDCFRYTGYELVTEAEKGTATP